MAAKRDAWVLQLEQGGLTPALVKSCLDGNAGQLEARMLALSRATPSPLGAQCAVALFTKFPLRFREQLGAGAAAVGAAWRHGAKASAFAKLKPPKAPNDDVPAWHQAVTKALSLALTHRASPPKPGAKSKSPGLPREGRDALQAAWLEKAKAHSPDDVPELMERFHEGPGTHLTARALELLSFPTDARIADALATFISRPSVRMAPETTVFTVLALAFAVHGDPSHRKAVETLTGNIDSLTWLEAALPAKAALKAKTETPRATSPGPTDEKSFLAFIAEKPDDDARVALFQDWLVERNDPRGEFMSLQRAGRELTPKEQKRVAALQKKHEKTWLRSFGPGMTKGSAGFRDGLPRAVGLYTFRASDVPLVDDPVLPLLEHLRILGGTNLPLPKLFEGPWRSLHSLIAADWILNEVDPKLLAQCDALGVIESGADLELEERLLALTRGPLPKLRHLTLSELSFHGVKSVEALRCLKSLQSLTLEVADPSQWLSLAGKVPLLHVLPMPNWDEAPHRLRFELRRGVPMRVTALEPAEGEAFTWHVLKVLEEVPKALRRNAILDVPYTGRPYAALRDLVK